jgi:hypothetical protein
MFLGAKCVSTIANTQHKENVLGKDESHDGAICRSDVRRSKHQWTASANADLGDVNTIDGITNARRTLMLLADGVGAVAVDELEDWALTKTGRSRAVKVIENFMVRE